MAKTEVSHIVPEGCRRSCNGNLVTMRNKYISINLYNKTHLYWIGYIPINDLFYVVYS